MCGYGSAVGWTFWIGDPDCKREQFKITKQGNELAAAL
jgi:hypothetical protein